MQGNLLFLCPYFLYILMYIRERGDKKGGRMDIDDWQRRVSDCCDIIFTTPH